MRPNSITGNLICQSGFNYLVLYIIDSDYRLVAFWFFLIYVIHPPDLTQCTKHHRCKSDPAFYIFCTSAILYRTQAKNTSL